jgi:hypothetical protein
MTRRMVHSPPSSATTTTNVKHNPAAAAVKPSNVTLPPTNVNVYQWIRELNDYVGCIENWATWLHHRLNHADTLQFLRMVQLSRQNYLHPQDIFRRQLRMEQPIAMTEVQTTHPPDLPTSSSS